MGSLRAMSGHLIIPLVVLLVLHFAQPSCGDLPPPRTVAQLDAQGLVEEALKAARSLSEANPDDPRAMSDLGGLLHKAGELGEAEVVLRRALELDPNSIQTLNNLAVTLLRDEAKADETEHYLRRCLALVKSPGETVALHNLASFLLDHGRQLEAEEELQRYMSLPEDQALASFLLLVSQLWLRPQHRARINRLGEEWGWPSGKLERPWDEVRRLQRYFPTSVNTLITWLGYRGELQGAESAELYWAISQADDQIMDPEREATLYPSNSITQIRDEEEEPTPSGLHLIVQHYAVDSEERQRDLRKCLEINLANPYIIKVHVLIDGQHEASLQQWSHSQAAFAAHETKLVVSHVGRRLTFADAFQYAATELEGQLVILANSDIYFDESLGRFGVPERLDMTGRVFALARWEGTNRLIPRVDSQDSWIFRSPIPEDVVAASSFELGRPRCDNRLAAVLRDLGNFEVTSPSMSIRSHHLDTSLGGPGILSYSVTEQVQGDGALVPQTLQWLF